MRVSQDTLHVTFTKESAMIDVRKLATGLLKWWANGFRTWPLRRARPQFEVLERRDCPAVTFTWTGQAFNFSWSDPNNWAHDGPALQTAYPTGDGRTDDSVIITGGTVNTNGIPANIGLTIKQLTLGGGSTLNLYNNLTLSGGDSVEEDAGTTLNVAGVSRIITLSNCADFDWTRGDITSNQDTGVLKINEGGAFHFDKDPNEGANVFSTLGVSLQNWGTIDTLAAKNVYARSLWAISNNGVVNINHDLRFSVPADVAYSMIGNGRNPSGTINFNADNHINLAVFNDGGTVNFNRGETDIWYGDLGNNGVSYYQEDGTTELCANSTLHVSSVNNGVRIIAGTLNVIDDQFQDIDAVIEDYSGHFTITGTNINIGASDDAAALVLGIAGGQISQCNITLGVSNGWYSGMVLDGSSGVLTFGDPNTGPDTVGFAGTTTMTDLTIVENINGDPMDPPTLDTAAAIVGPNGWSAQLQHDDSDLHLLHN
jgi:hypothetical protein